MLVFQHIIEQDAYTCLPQYLRIYHNTGSIPCVIFDIIIIIIIHQFHGNTSLKQDFRATVNVTY